MMTSHNNDEPNAPNLTPEETRSLQDWLATPAPGEAKLQDLHVAFTRPQAGHRPRGLAWYYQVAAGLALFFAGYLSGNAVPQPDSYKGSQLITATPIVEANQGTVPPVVAFNDTSNSNAITPTPPEAPSQNPSENCNSPQFYQGDDGRLRIDTVLCKTGSHATWVVNPRLEIANLKQENTNVEEN